MKIAVRKIGPLGTTYGPEFNEEFFDKLWQDMLLSKLDYDDEVIWMDHMPVNVQDFDNMLSDFDAVIGAWIKPNMITEEILNKHPKLRYIGTISHGYSEFDKKACKKHNVTVTNTIFNDDSVAQHAFALLLEICNNVGINNAFYKKEKWESDMPKFNKLYTKQIGLTGKTIGIIGLGNIGVKTAQIAHGFGMSVLACSKSIKNGKIYNNINQTSIDNVLTESDIIFIHCSLNDNTRNLINSTSIRSMKKM